MTFTIALVYINAAGGDKYIILTDWLNSIYKLKYLYHKNHVAQKIKRELHVIQQHGKNIRFIWIPSHIGIQGNEEAYEYASGAINSTEIETVTKGVSTDNKLLLLLLLLWIWVED